MYIEPNSTIKIYTFVPLDNTYEHTLWFDSLEAQNNYFHGDTGILRKAYNNNSYQRVNKGTMRINEKADFLYNASYLGFQNSNFGNKWFYAFITSVNYVNNSVCEITYEIDVMQTYLFDVALKQCWVEREHASIDAIGFNIVPEPVELGSYVQYGDSVGMFDSGTDTPSSDFDAAIVVACSEKYSPEFPPDPTTWEEGTWEPSDGAIITGVYQGVTFNVFTGINKAEQVNGWLKKATKDNKQDAIISIFMCPSYLVLSMLNSRGHYPDKELGGLIGTDFGGYVPKNNKLYTYPYNLLYATCGDGKFMQYRFEWFDDIYNPKFSRYGQMSCTPSACIIPRNYKHGSQKSTHLDEMFNEFGDTDLMLVKDNFPICSYTIDSYRAWLAQNQFNLGSAIFGGALSNGVKSGISGAGGGVAGAVSGAVSGVVGTTLDVATQVMNANLLPDSNRGNTNGNNLLFTMGADNIYVCRKGVQSGYAKLIDDFFTKYGYAMQYIKVPNRNARKEFTYTKTKGCVAIGLCPADDTRKICEIYDNGITFWKNPNHLGDYSVDNSPL